MITFTTGAIHDVIWRPLRKFADARGWLCELFRNDETPAAFRPVMAYISETQPGVARGPHEHVDQADYFCFLGPGNFKVYLWDNRPASPTYRFFHADVVGENKPMALIVPPGVVHAYRNLGPGPGLVFNAPNRLYRGEGKKDPVDEIRHEEHADSIFKLD